MSIKVGYTDLISLKCELCKQLPEHVIVITKIFDNFIDEKEKRSLYIKKQINDARIQNIKK